MSSAAITLHGALRLNSRQRCTSARQKKGGSRRNCDAKKLWKNSIQSKGLWNAGLRCSQKVRCLPSSTELPIQKGVVGQSLDRLLQPINTQANDITTTRTAVLQCLPLHLGDDSSEFFIRVSDSDTNYDFTQVPVGVLSVMTEDTPPKISSIAIILEGNLVLDEIPTHAQALCLLFGLIYALHLDYPKGMKNTFEFIQKILLNLGQQKLSPKLQTLKNALLI
ncbi:hypothetical protein SKAU_G00037400 [Synaphobranchus kaupii]|uniref:Uncharacterized protein n=1 Tax=Synaphobranchus kaupii TaxID=118154 RepID=A0A9Q1JH36_SYNKA|nr:hypothetical protein SKAU_G00037400 [Synaphobranchus kaupii]